MFGYLNVNQPEMKIKDFNKYHSYYCGLCTDLQKSFGLTGKLTLTYDMTFLAVLLSSLYEPKTSHEMIRCPLHPVHKQPCRTNWCTEYVADMNLIATCYQLQDDYLDEHKLRGLAGNILYRKRFHNLKQKYPQKIQSINHTLHLLRECEQNNETNIDKVLGYSGDMIAQLFVPKEDLWANTLRETGFYLGKFIYLMDAFEDLDKDEKNGCYNPLLPLRHEEDFKMRCESYLVSTISQCTKSFERLPLVEDIEILRNILYSGIWTRYELIKSGKINTTKNN